MIPEKKKILQKKDPTKVFLSTNIFSTKFYFTKKTTQNKHTQTQNSVTELK